MFAEWVSEHHPFGLNASVLTQPMTEPGPGRDTERGRAASWWEVLWTRRGWCKRYRVCCCRRHLYCGWVCMICVTLGTKGGVDNVQISWVHQRRPRCRWCFPQSFAPESSTPVIPWLRPATKKINRGAEVHRLQKALWAWKFNQYLCIVCPLWHYVHTQIFTYIILTKAECSCCSLHWLLWTLLLSRITMTTIKWMFGSVAFSKRLFSSTVYFRVGIILNLLIHLHTFACFLSLSLI